MRKLLRVVKGKIHTVKEEYEKAKGTDRTSKRKDE